jgi:small subunit ribosomal protein S8e
MAIIQARSKRKPTGGRYTSTLTKRKHMVGRPATMTKIGEEKRKSVRTKGGSSKEKLLNATIANLTDPKTKKTIKATIKDVLENPANRYFVRRDIITKGTIIETDKGNAKVTSRPAQDGVVNAVLME